MGKEDLTGVKVAVLSSDAPTGDAFRGAVSEALEKLGAEIVLSQGGVPAGATNVQTYVDAILSSGAELSVIVTDFVGMLSLQGTLKANGYTGAMVNFAGFIPGILESSKDLQGALEGSYIGTVIPTTFDGTPAGDQMKADFDAVGAAPTFGALLGLLGYRPVPPTPRSSRRGSHQGGRGRERRLHVPAGRGRLRDQVPRRAHHIGHLLGNGDGEGRRLQPRRSVLLPGLIQPTVMSGRLGDEAARRRPPTRFPRTEQQRR